MTDQFLFNETNDPAKLNNRQRGQLAEIAFMRKAASFGLSFAKPWGEGERYDFIVRVSTICWRIQVKSVLAKSRPGDHYRIKTCGGNTKHGHTTYSGEEIDFLVAYIFPENIWYVFPASALGNRKVICVVPGSERSRFEQYREAWKLMKPPMVQATIESTLEIMPEP